MEQSDARQSGLERLRERNRQQRAADRLTQDKLGLHESGRLTNEEGRLKHTLSQNEPACATTIKTPCEWKVDVHAVQSVPV